MAWANLNAAFDLYMEKWLKETGGSFSFGTDVTNGDLRVTCTNCLATHSNPIPLNPMAIDYSLQQFVNGHLHKVYYTYTQDGYPIVPVMPVLPMALPDVRINVP